MSKNLKKYNFHYQKKHKMQQNLNSQITEIISNSITKSNEKLLQTIDEKFIDIVNEALSHIKFIKNDKMIRKTISEDSSTDSLILRNNLFQKKKFLSEEDDEGSLYIVIQNYSKLAFPKVIGNTIYIIRNYDKYKGIKLFQGKWEVKYKFRGTYLHGGFFNSSELAAIAYDNLIKSCYGFKRGKRFMNFQYPFGKDIPSIKQLKNEDRQFY